MSGRVRVPMGATRRDAVLERVQHGPAPETGVLSILARVAWLSPLERIAVMGRAPTVEQLLALSHDELLSVIGRSSVRAEWRPRRHLAGVESDRLWLRASREHRLVGPGSAGYPGRLLRLYDPPAALYLRGTAEGAPLDRVVVGMVGTRKPDAQGREAAFALAGTLARAGAGIASGLALGIDATAHRGMIAAGAAGQGLIVLGAGPDQVSPTRNRPVAADILDGGGLIVSEYPPGTPAARHRFPARNRLIAGLSDALVAFQAPADSGSLITAEFALQLDIPVMVHSSAAGWAGSQALLADAPDLHEVTTRDEVLAVLHDGGVIDSETMRAGRAAGAWHPDEGRADALKLFGMEASPASLAEFRAALRAPAGGVES